MAPCRRSNQESPEITQAPGRPSGRTRCRRSAVRSFATVLSVSLLAAAVTGSAGASTVRRPASPRGTGHSTVVTVPASVIGAYAGGGATGGLARVDSVLGTRVHWAMDFLPGWSWSAIDHPAWFLRKWDPTRYRMVWGVPMLPAQGASLEQGAAGAYDGYFRALARRLVAGHQASSVIRLGWEFNGSWFPWAANHHAHSFVVYWRHIVRAMRSVRGQRFSFEWNPTRGNLAVGQLSQYYPGRRYVDIIGLDIYDAELGSYPGPTREWQRMLTQPFGLDWLARFGAQQGKPLALPEWGLGWNGGGLVSGGDNPYFVQHIASWISTHHVVNAIAWDYGSNPLPAYSEPQALASFVKVFGR